MPITSLLRSRRLSKRHSEATRQVITFYLCQEWFALTIESVQKVVPLGSVYGDPKNQGISLTTYQDREVVVIDVGHRIFGEKTHANSPFSSPENDPAQRYLIVLQNFRGEVVGLPIDSQPVLKRVPVANFAPLPETYLSQGNIHCISSVMIQVAHEPAIFLLDSEQLTIPLLTHRP